MHSMTTMQLRSLYPKWDDLMLRLVAGPAQVFKPLFRAVVSRMIGGRFAGEWYIIKVYGCT